MPPAKPTSAPDEGPRTRPTQMITTSRRSGTTPKSSRWGSSVVWMTRATRTKADVPTVRRAVTELLTRQLCPPGVEQDQDQAQPVEVDVGRDRRRLGQPR